MSCITLPENSRIPWQRLPDQAPFRVAFSDLVFIDPDTHGPSR